jgi:ATP-dependent Clp protease protease subunit
VAAPQKTSRLRPSATTALEQELLAEEIRKMRSEADMAEIELAAKADGERDRLVKTGRIRHLFINDLISGTNSDKWLDALTHWERRDPGEPITIDIHSPGGSVTDGLAIYDQILAMRRKGHHVTTRGRGQVASMAAVLLQAGDERVMDARAKMLIHQGGMQIQGTMSRSEQDDMRAFQNMLLEDILDILSERSTLSRRQLQNRWDRRDWWITAPDVVKFGFADRIE